MHNRHLISKCDQHLFSFDHLATANDADTDTDNSLDIRNTAYIDNPH